MEEDGGELLKAETSQRNKRSRNAASLCLKTSALCKQIRLILSCGRLCFHLGHFPSFIELKTREDGCSTAGWLRSRSPGRRRRPHPTLASSSLTCWGLDSAGVPLSIDYTFVAKRSSLCLPAAVCLLKVIIVKLTKAKTRWSISVTSTTPQPPSEGKNATWLLYHQDFRKTSSLTLRSRYSNSSEIFSRCIKGICLKILCCLVLELLCSESWVSMLGNVF